MTSVPGPGSACLGAEPDAAKSAAETDESIDTEADKWLSLPLNDPQCRNFVVLCAWRMRLSEDAGIERLRKYATKSEVHRLAIHKYLNLEMVKSTTPEGQTGKVYKGLQMLLNISELEE